MLLELTDIRKAFGPVQALVGVDFAINSGEVVGLVGDNGAGKSTLAKVIAGEYRPDHGAMRFEGHEIQLHNPSDASEFGIHTVYQDLALCDNLDVVANLFLGRELAAGRGPFQLRHLSEVAMEQIAVDTLSQLKIVTLKSPRVLVGAVSGGQRQAIAIARAVLRAAKLFVLDEPTAALGVSQVAEVRRLICELRERNSAVVVISHNLEDIFATADRICVLRLGRNAGSFVTSQTSSDEVVGAITGSSAHR